MDSFIQSTPNPTCALCGNPGERLYAGLQDRLFGTPGEWNISRCQNASCGLLWLDPMPVEEDLWKAYQTYYTHGDRPVSGSLVRNLYHRIKDGYLAHRFGYSGARVNPVFRVLGFVLYLFPGRRAIADFEVFHLPSVKDGRLLEVGCGSGAMMNAMSNRGWNTEGVDFDPGAVETARKKGLNVSLGTLAEQRFPANTYDAIVMSHVIEHVPDPLAVIGECHRILKRGGLLVMITPNSTSLSHQVFQSNWRGLEPPRHLYIFNLRLAPVIVGGLGLTVHSAFTSIRGADGMFLASRSLQKSKIGTGSAQVPSQLRAWSHLMQAWEWLVHKIRPTIGEELVIIYKKL